MNQLTKFLEWAGIPPKWAGMIAVICVTFSLGFSARGVYTAAYTYAVGIDSLRVQNEELQTRVRAVEECTHELIIFIHTLSTSQEHAFQELKRAHPQNKVLIQEYINDLPHHYIQMDTVPVVLHINPKIP